MDIYFYRKVSSALTSGRFHMPVLTGLHDLKCDDYNALVTNFWLHGIVVITLSSKKSLLRIAYYASQCCFPSNLWQSTDTTINVVILKCIALIAFKRRPRLRGEATVVDVT